MQSSNSKADRKAARFFGIPGILPYVKPYRKKLIFIICLGMISSCIDAATPLFNRYALNHFVGERTLDTLAVFITLYVIVLSLQVADNFLSTSICGQVEVEVNRDLRDASFTHLQNLSFSYFNQNPVGYIHARVMSDTSKIGETVAWHMMDIVWCGSYVVAVLVVMLCIHRPLALAMVGVVLLSALVSALFQRAMVRYERMVREQNAVITGDFNEGITGSLTVKLLGIAAKMDRSFFRDTEKMRRTSVGSARVGAFFTASVALMSQTALALVLWQGGILNREGVMMIGTLSVFLSYALGIMEPIRQLVRTFSRLTAISASIERFTDLMNTEPGIRDSEEVVERYGDSFNPKKENWEELYGDVEFEDVTFIYPDGEEKVLEHFSLKVKRGQNVAIVGETGAGKSTLVNLICRFYEPVEGRVLIDGRDVRERSLLWLHSHIGYVLQTPYLFSGSIRENLKYGRENATDEEIMQALAMVSADGIVKAMEQGLDSEVGEGGMSLSTGEKQLISFARALLSDPAILILDEATSSVDTVTEQKIQKAISLLTKDRTSFVIAHRLSTIVDSDLILAVSEGRIVEQGTHRELMQRKGYYYTLYTRQFEQLAVDSIDKNKNI